MDDGTGLLAQAKRHGIMVVELDPLEAENAVQSLRTLLNALAEGLAYNLALRWPEETEERAAVLADITAAGDDIAQIAKLIQRIEARPLGRAID